MRLQAECSSFESALWRLAAAAASVGDVLAEYGAAFGTGTLRGPRRVSLERQSATAGAAPGVAATTGAARCGAALQQAARCLEQPRCGEGQQAGGDSRPDAAQGPGSAAGRKGESAVDVFGSALPDRAPGWGGDAERGPAPMAPSGGKRAARDAGPGLARGSGASHSTPGARAGIAVTGSAWQAPQDARVGEDGNAQGAVLQGAIRAMDAGGGPMLSYRIGAPDAGQAALHDGPGVAGGAATSGMPQAAWLESPAPLDNHAVAPGVVQPVPHAAAADGAGGDAAVEKCEAAGVDCPTLCDGCANTVAARQAAQRGGAAGGAGGPAALGGCRAAGVDSSAPPSGHANTRDAKQAAWHAGAAGSAGGGAAFGAGENAGVDSREAAPEATKWRGVSQVWEGGELCYAAGIKRSKRSKLALQLGTFATGAPPPRPRMPSACLPAAPPLLAACSG